MVLAAITTCRRKPELLNRAIKSVVNQTYHDWELVIVDDSPSDYEFRSDVKKLAEDWSTQDSRIKYIPLDKNYGLTHARNVALKIAANTQGGGGHDFIAFLDDDDEWLPEKLEKQLAKFNEYGEDTVLVSCGFYGVDDDMPEERTEMRPEEKIYTGDELYGELTIANIIYVFCLLRTKCLAEIGGFDENLRAVEDWETWIRLAKRFSNGKFIFQNDILGIHYSQAGREHLGGNALKQARGLEILIKKNYDYLIEHKYNYYCLLKFLLYLYLGCGEYINFFRTLYKILLLKPEKVPVIRIITKRFIVILYISFKKLVYSTTTNLFNRLKRIQDKIKGEN